MLVKKILKISMIFLCGLVGVLFLHVPGFFLLPSQTVSPSFQEELFGSRTVQEVKSTSDQMAIFVINLDRNPERYRDIHEHVLVPLGLPFFRVKAIYGKELPQKQRDELTSYKVYRLAFNGNRPGPGEFGCFASHVKAWREFLASSYQTALILEDDVQLCFTPPVTLALLSRARDISDVCFLDAQGTAHQEVFSALSLDDWRQGNIHAFGQLSFQESINAGAYLINRRAARSLLDKAHQFCLPADHYIQRAWEFSLSTTHLSPRLFHQKAVPSDIESDRRIPFKRSIPERLFQRLETQMCLLKRDMARVVFQLWSFVKILWKEPPQKK
jgi:GR25 family glycosyltransferase involved in LPS biosynthesis